MLIDQYTMVSTQTSSTWVRTYLMCFYACVLSSQATTSEVADQCEYDYIDDSQVQRWRDNEGYAQEGEYLELTATPRERTDNHYMELTARHVDSNHVDNNA